MLLKKLKLNFQFYDISNKILIKFLKLNFVYLKRLALENKLCIFLRPTINSIIDVMSKLFLTLLRTDFY